MSKKDSKKDSKKENKSSNLKQILLGAQSTNSLTFMEILFCNLSLTYKFYKLNKHLDKMLKK